MGYITTEFFKEYQGHQEILCRTRQSLMEHKMEARMATIEAKITNSNLLMKFTAGIATTAMFILGLAISLGWV